MPEFLRSSSRHRLFALLLGLSCLAYWRPLWALGQFSLRSEQYSHILVIPIVALTLLFQERDKIFSRAESSWRAGAAGVAFGVVLYALGLHFSSSWSENDRLSLAILSLVVVWLGLFLMFYGRAAFRAGLFPLCFLFLMVPIPEAILDPTIRVLQQASGEVTGALFRILGVPVYREGLVFSLPGVTIEVARECSGIRSSLALFVTSLLAGHLFLRSRTRRILLCAAVFPITVFKNGLRIVMLSVIAAYVDPAILDSTAHRRGGIPFFGLALLVLGAVLWFLRRMEGGAWIRGRAPVDSAGRSLEPSVK